MRTFLFIIFVVPFFNISFSQTKAEECSLNIQVKVIINKADTVSSNGLFSIFVDKHTHSNIIDSIGGLYLYDLQEGEHTIQIQGWNLQIDTVLHISPTIPNEYTFYVDVDCEVNRYVAMEDIKKNKIKLLIVGGIAPIGNTVRDNIFEQKYNLKYYDYGDTPPSYECIRNYNRIIFKYLDSKYGIEWRVWVRKDVEGI